MSNRSLAPNPQAERVSASNDLLKSARAARRSMNRALGKNYYKATDDEIRSLLSCGWRVRTSRIFVQP